MPIGNEFLDTNEKLFDTKEIAVSTVAVEAVTDGGVADRYARQSVRIYNQGPNTIYVGPSGTTAPGGAKTGEPVRKFQWIKYDVRGDNTTVFMICDSGQSANVIVTDLG